MRKQEKCNFGYLREISHTRRNIAPMPRLYPAANDNGRNTGDAPGAISSLFLVLMLALVEIATIAALMSAIADWDFYGV